jgi:hypothetical protein
MGNCSECGEFDCDIDHDKDDDWGENSEDETGYSGSCAD